MICVSQSLKGGGALWFSQDSGTSLDVVIAIEDNTDYSSESSVELVASLELATDDDNVLISPNQTRIIVIDDEGKTDVLTL